MHKALIYIALGTLIGINKISSENLPKYTYLNQDSSTKFNIVYANLRPKQQILYNKIDKHINYLSQDIYNFCVNNKTSMNSSANNALKVQDQIESCMVSSLNSFSYDQNPKAFIRMMKQLKIIKEDWEYANALYVSIIFNKYSKE